MYAQQSKQEIVPFVTFIMHLGDDRYAEYVEIHPYLSLPCEAHSLTGFSVS